jgi:hypothetical protein
MSDVCRPQRPTVLEYPEHRGRGSAQALAQLAGRGSAETHDLMLVRQEDDGSRHGADPSGATGMPLRSAGWGDADEQGSGPAASQRPVRGVEGQDDGPVAGVTGSDRVAR